MLVEHFIDYLACPATGEKLVLSNEISTNGSDRVPISRTNGNLPVPESFGLSKRILLCESGDRAFPVIDEIPILLTPEQLLDRQVAVTAETIDLRDPRYAEAYEEMDFYNSVNDELADETTLRRRLGPLADIKDFEALTQDFPHPPELWIDATHDSISQLEAYDYLAPVLRQGFRTAWRVRNTRSEGTPGRGKARLPTLPYAGRSPTCSKARRKLWS